MPIELTNWVNHVGNRAVARLLFTPILANYSRRHFGRKPVMNAVRLNHTGFSNGDSRPVSPASQKRADFWWLNLTAPCQFFRGNLTADPRLEFPVRAVRFTGLCNTGTRVGEGVGGSGCRIPPGRRPIATTDVIRAMPRRIGFCRQWGRRSVAEPHSLYLPFSRPVNEMLSPLSMANFPPN